MGKGTTELVDLLVLLGMGAVVPLGLALIGEPGLKRAGRREPAVTPWWDTHRYRWGSPDTAWLHDPFLHPPLSLPDYVRRQNALLDGAELPGCPACGEEGPAVPVPTGHGHAELCRSCARVLTPCPCGQWHSFEPTIRIGWRRTWRREHMSGTGEPDPHWPGVRGTARIERLAAYHSAHGPS